MKPKKTERTTDQDPAFYFCTVAVFLFGFPYDATGCIVFSYCLMFFT